MDDDFRIDPPDGRDREPARGGRHPVWSRIFYGLYGLASGGAAAGAIAFGMTDLAIVAGLIALVLLWKATQKVR